MGTDINAYVAYKAGDGNLEPFMYGSLDLGRDYELFGLMAGIRGEARLFESRGLPDRIPSIYQFFFDRSDGIAASWLTTAEVRLVAEEYPQVFERQSGQRRMSPYLAAIVGLMEGVDAWAKEYDPGGGAILIFWFDG
jgi:hypothetical protein